jgi:proliferating cell nuclear antigen
MFKIVLSDVDLLKNSIPIIAEIIDEGIFNIDQNGMSLLSPDRTMVSVVDFRVPSSAFEEFKVEGQEALGLNLANLTAVLKRAKGSDKITLESGQNKLKVKIISSGTRTFEIPLIDVRTEKPPVDQLAFTATVDMDSAVLEEGVTDAELIGDSITLEAVPGLFRVFARGDTSSTQLEVKSGESGLNVQAKASVKAQYPLDYLKKMIKASKLAKQLKLEFGQDYPMRLIFKDVDKIQLSFILAPRVQE